MAKNRKNQNNNTDEMIENVTESEVVEVVSDNESIVKETQVDTVEVVEDIKPSDDKFLIPIIIHNDTENIVKGMLEPYRYELVKKTDSDGFISYYVDPVNEEDYREAIRIISGLGIVFKVE